MKNPVQVTPLAESDALQRASEVNILPQMAVLNIFRTLLHHPKLAKTVNDLLLTLLTGDNKLETRFRELLIMRIGWATKCDYEWTQHWRIALQAGLDEKEILAVRDWRDSPLLSDHDKAILMATDETLADGMISEETTRQCRQFLDDACFLELNVALGTWRLISQLAKSSGIELEAGVASWPPTGDGP